MAEPNCLPRGDREKGFVLACVARPLTTIEIDLSAEVDPPR
jgi:hypothetical protein